MIGLQTSLFSDSAKFNRKCYSWNQENDENHVAYLPTLL